MGYGPADRRYGYAGRLVEGGNAAGPPFEAAIDDLIHDAQLIERTVASILLGHQSEQIPTGCDNGLSRYLVWSIRHTLLTIQINSR